MNLLCLFFMIFLAAFGFIDLIKSIFKKLLFQNKKVPIKEVKIPIYGHCENIEFIIRKIIFKYTWLQENSKVVIKIINNGADDETLKICENLTKKISNIELI